MDDLTRFEVNYHSEIQPRRIWRWFWLWGYVACKSRNKKNKTVQDQNVTFAKSVFNLCFMVCMLTCLFCF